MTKGFGRASIFTVPQVCGESVSPFRVGKTQALTALVKASRVIQEKRF